MPTKHYRKLYLGRGHTWADHKGYVSTHRLVMMRHLKRRLLPHEFVHHRDGDIHNNNISNLVVMTPSNHSHHHRVLHGTWAKQYTRCRACLTIDWPHQGNGLCRRCYKWRRRRGVDRPQHAVDGRSHPGNTSTTHYCVGCYKILPLRMFHSYGSRCKSCYANAVRLRYGQTICQGCGIHFGKRHKLQCFCSHPCFLSHQH